jgi:putative FmdB family regulatory protein
LPLYDYQCKQCRQIAEVRHGFTDVYSEACSNCGGAMSRVFNAAGIVFKGSGFYITDSRQGNGESKGSGESNGNSESKGIRQSKSGGEGAPAATPAAAVPAAAPAAESKKSDAA